MRLRYIPNNMKTRNLYAFSVFLLFVCPCQSQIDWLQQRKWEDGLAEVCLYEGKLLKYGALRDSALELITVREHFDPERLVKTRPAPGKRVLPVMKQNLVRRTRTGVYEYMQMSSVFLHRETGELLKLSVVSAEWCGNSFALFERKQPHATLHISNYMDDRGSTTFELTDVPLFYDEIIPLLRQNLATWKPGMPLNVAASLLSNSPDYTTVTGRVTAINRRQLNAAGKSRSAIDVAVDMDGREEHFVFEDVPMRPLLEWSNDKGEVYRLRKRLFMDYWNRNRLGDERMIE